MVGKTMTMGGESGATAEAAAPPPLPPPPDAAPSASSASPQRVPGEAEPLSPSGRLLSDLVEESIRCGLHAPESFIDRFPPDAIMAELAEEPRLRAKILTATLNLPAQTAEMLPPAVAGAALATALQANDASARSILDQFAPDDRVRQLPWAALWAFVVEGGWWKTPDDRTKNYTLFLLERAWEHGLVDPNVWRDGLTISKLAAALPRDLVEKLFERAASLGASGKSLTGAEIFGIVKPAALVAAFEPEYLFDRVALPLARRSHFLVEGGSVPPQRSTQTELRSASPSNAPGPAKAVAESDDDAWGDGEDALAERGGKKKQKAKTAG